MNTDKSDSLNSTVKVRPFGANVVVSIKKNLKQYCVLTKNMNVVNWTNKVEVN